MRLVLNIHGGAFMLGSSKMVNHDQIQDCLDRGWLVVAPNHRLCPQVNLLEGPMQDCRDLLAWIYEGGLERSLSHTRQRPLQLDMDHVFAFGTSSGGTLALSLVGNIWQISIYDADHRRGLAYPAQWLAYLICMDHASSTMSFGLQSFPT